MELLLKKIFMIFLEGKKMENKKMDNDTKEEIIDAAEYLLYKIEQFPYLNNYVVEINKLINKLNTLVGE